FANLRKVRKISALNMEQSNKPIIKHLNDFLDYCDIEKGLRNNTQKNYKEYLNKFFKWLKYKNLQGLLPHQLTKEHIWEYRLYLSRRQDPKTGKSLKKTTQNYYLIALRAFLAYFVAKDIVSLPPGKVTLPKPDKSVKTVKFLNLEQVEKLLTAVEPKDNIRLRDRAILETLFSTGLRIAELVSLNTEQFANIKNKKDFELGIIGKGGNPRTVYFSKRALNWIKKYLETRTDKEKPLFVNARSRKDAESRLTARYIEKLVKKYAMLSGIPIFTTPHTLRHSYATDLLAQGVDLRSIQEFLGHRSIMTTQIYTHITNKHLRDIHRKFHGGKDLKE
ncbi:MAG: tyrosine-type recombinase/integrase, partial [Patescibacteria group bacterium]